MIAENKEGTAEAAVAEVEAVVVVVVEMMEVVVVATEDLIAEVGVVMLVAEDLNPKLLGEI